MGKRFYKPDGTEIEGLREARKHKCNPSVTTVIDACSPHSYRWMDYQRLKEALESDSSVEEKLDILGNQAVFETGTLIHAVAEAYGEMGMKSDPLGCPHSSKEMYRIIDKYKDRKQEIFLYSDVIRTGGRLDILGTYEGKLTIGDLKTVTKLAGSAKPIWKVQLGAYYGLAQENGIEVEQAMVFQFSKQNLGCIPVMINKKELEHAFLNFKRLRGVFEYFMNI